ncbi:MAG: hypothetical protein WD558_09370 [Pseudomonadales bacterium]
MKRLPGLMLFLMLSVSLCQSALAGFDLVSDQTTIAGTNGVTETLWQTGVPPHGKYDRIGLHRYHQPGAPAIAAMLYLPGTNMNGEFTIINENHNLWLYLARRGVVVYTLDYRTHFVPNEPVIDTGFMKDWPLNRFVDDAALALEHIRGTEDRIPVYVSGFSRGVTYAYALASRTIFSGLIVLDGGFKDFETEIDDKVYDKEAALAQLEASGSWGQVLSRSRGWGSRAELMKRTYEDPNGPAMGKFDSIGEQLTSTLYNAWGPGVLANPVDGISSIQVLARAMEGYDRNFPTRHTVEARSIAVQKNDPSTSLDDQYGAMSMPVIYFGATNLGADNLLHGIYSASRSGSNDVTVHVLENHGHLDVLYGNRASELVYDPIQRWIAGHSTATPE